MKNILLWSPNGAGLHYYGAGTNAYNLYKRMRTQEVFNLVLAHANEAQKDNEIYDQVCYIGSKTEFGVLKPLFVALSSLKILWKYRNANYIFHGLDAYTDTIFPALLARMLGYKVALKVASYPSPFTSSRMGVIAFIRRRVAKCVHKYFVISSEIEHELRSVGLAEDRLCMVYNGVDCEVFQPNATSSDRDELSVLFTGAIARRKRPHLVIEALCEMDRDWQLVLVGPLQDESYYQELLSYCEAQGVSDRVRFEGFQKEIGKFYKAADVYVLPSEREGMPNGALEAMACGLPVLFSPFSSSGLLCNGRNGFVVPEGESFSPYFEKLLSLNLEDLGAESRRIAEQTFSLGTVADSYIRAFKELE